MALNYSVHPQSSGGNGPANSLPAPILQIDGGERALAHGSVSAAINGPCEICVVADEDCWLDASKVEGDLDGATSPLKIIANVPQWFSIQPGIWKLRSAAA
jgi:hypothetical protein